MATDRAVAKHWCFTLNNPELNENEIIDELEAFGIEYAVFQMEEGENGTPHFQGYVAFLAPQRLSATRRLFNSRAHWEKCRGTPTQNRDYCTKPEGRIGDFVEIGTLPPPAGARQDLALLHSRLKSGLTQSQYVEEFFPLFVRHPNLVQNYVVSCVEPRDGSPVSSWLLIGPPGTGKSRFATVLAKRIADGLFYRHSLGKWFDGYRGERTLLFDDFSGSCLPFTTFKCLVDRYPFRVELKGLTCNMAATNFIITTNEDPQTWWSAEVTGQHGHAAIFRRIGLVLLFGPLNHFRLYRSYAEYARENLRLYRDGEIFVQTPPLQAIQYEEEEVLFDEAVCQAQIQ